MIQKKHDGHHKMATTLLILTTCQIGSSICRYLCCNCSDFGSDWAYSLSSYDSYKNFNFKCFTHLFLFDIFLQQLILQVICKMKQYEGDNLFNCLYPKRKKIDLPKHYKTIERMARLQL